MQDTKDGKFSPDIFGIKGQLDYRISGGFHKNAVKDFLMGIDQGMERFG